MAPAMAHRPPFPVGWFAVATVGEVPVGALVPLAAFGRDLAVGRAPGGRALVSGFRYLIMGALGASFYLLGVSYFYAATGTLNMADLAFKIQNSSGELDPMLTILAMVFLFVFGTKAAIFPLFFWLPGPYFQPSAGLSAFFGGILTKVGVYAIFRTFTLLFRHAPSFTHELLLVLAALTIFIGVFGALLLAAMFIFSRRDFK